VQHKDYGKVSIGVVSHASDNAAILPDGSGSLVPANWVLFDGISFFARSGGVRTTVAWGALNACTHENGAGIAGDCNGVPREAIRYDSPTYNGFSLSASGGQDKFWDITGRYAGEMHGFKLAGAASYSATDDCSYLAGGYANCANYLNGLHSGYFQFGGYAEHIATGLFVYGAVGTEFNDNTYTPGGIKYKDGTKWYIKPGIRASGILPFGHTVFYGEYGEANDMMAGNVAMWSASDFQQWGLGAVQEIDPAAMSLWIKYRNYSGDSTDRVTGLKTNYEAWQTVVFGALINF